MTRLGMVAALPAEARCLGVAQPRPGQRYLLNANTAVHIGGMGTAHAGRAARLLRHDGVDALVSWGLCAALDRELAAGALVLPTAIVTANGSGIWHTDADWRTRLHERLAATTRLRIHTGVLLTHDAVIRTAQDKQRLQHDSGAVAADMESAAIASVAQQAGLAFMAIRSVSDTADMALPTTALALLNRNGRLQPLRGGAHWLRHPTQTGALLRLAGGARQARHCLQQVARQTGAQQFCLREPECAAGAAGPASQ